MWFNYRVSVPRRPSARKEAWMPKYGKGRRPHQPVPERFRHVRLRRRRFSKMTRSPLMIRIILVAAIIAFAYFALRGHGGVRAAIERIPNAAEQPK